MPSTTVPTENEISAATTEFACSAPASWLLTAAWTEMKMPTQKARPNNTAFMMTSLTRVTATKRARL
jgi:hypothetical protein